MTGPNGNSIFLPAAGFYVASTHAHDNFGGHYWTSSFGYSDIGPLDDLSVTAHHLYFHSSYFNVTLSDTYEGMTIRPVLAQ